MAGKPTGRRDRRRERDLVSQRVRGWDRGRVLVQRKSVVSVDDCDRVRRGSRGRDVGRPAQFNAIARSRDDPVHELARIAIVGQPCLGRIDGKERSRRSGARGQRQTAGGQARTGHAHVLGDQVQGGANVLLHFRGLVYQPGRIHSVLEQLRRGGQNDQAQGHGDQQFDQTEAADFVSGGSHLSPQRNEAIKACT